MNVSKNDDIKHLSYKPASKLIYSIDTSKSQS